MPDTPFAHDSAPYLAPRPDGRPDAWTEETRARGRVGGQRILFAGEVPADEEIATRLDVPVGEPVVVRRRIIELDGVPTELTDTHYPTAIARDTALAGTAKITGGAVTLLARLGHVGARITEEITARLPTPAERELLALPTDPPDPLLRVTRTTHDAHGRPIQVDVMLMPASRNTLHHETPVPPA
ncbi:GntR family transcriptional regulator [Streptomyces sp. BI20]|uniref:GntR family transcriptional regulator n=1 Tax=Streptomyces sp. BI20 TaxID=3403460 RepID=UPI003C7899DF